MSLSHHKGVTLHAPHLTLSVESTPGPDGSLDISLYVALADGWKLFGRDNPSGVPLSVTATPATGDVTLDVPRGVVASDSRLMLHVPRPSDTHQVWLNYQLCNGDLCLRPASIEIPVTSIESPRLSDEVMSEAAPAAAPALGQ